jgi:hypothetical protein
MGRPAAHAHMDQKYTATRDRTHRFPKDKLELNAQMTEYNDSKTSIEQSNV